MAVLMPPILCGLIYILRSASPYMPIYLWLFFLGLQLTMLTVYPSLIAPLFNTYKPLPTNSLRSSIEKLAEKVEFPLKKLFEVDGSKRSGHSNAYMYGFGKNKRIVLYDTLLQQCKTDDQVCLLFQRPLFRTSGNVRCTPGAGIAAWCLPLNCLPCKLRSTIAKLCEMAFCP
jgi:STE24 endopeptidase